MGFNHTTARPTAHYLNPKGMYNPALLAIRMPGSVVSVKPLAHRALQQGEGVCEVWCIGCSQLKPGDSAGNRVYVYPDC
jgi:hypothetical protein